MLFHCVPVDMLLAQMDRSFDTQELLPLLHSRGGAILTDRKVALVEKNWSPFVIGNVLYITYSIRPHVVMRCDWDLTLDALKCETVQEDASPDLGVYESVGHIQADLRGSSTGLQLPLPDRGYLSLGHVRQYAYQYFFYKFVGDSPPFQIVAFSPLFTLPAIKGSQLQYAHGIIVEPDGVTISYGVNDAASWYVKAPLPRIHEMFASPQDSQVNWGKMLFDYSHPVEIPPDLFGRSLEYNIHKMERSLESSNTDVASDFLKFLHAIPNVTLDDFLARLSLQRQLYHDTSHALEELEKTCADNTAGMDPDCVGTNRLLARTVDAFRAYNLILSRAHRIIQDVFERIYVRAEVSFEIPSVKSTRKLSAGDMSYVKAAYLALQDKISLPVVEAMRSKHVQAEASRSASLLEAKIMLAVSLLRMGNVSPAVSVYTRLYQECDEVLTSALALHPGHSTVLTLKNLRAVQAKFSLRFDKIENNTSY